MKYIFWFSLLIIPAFSYSQHYNPEKVNPKAISLYNHAIELLQDGNLDDAMPYLDKAIAADKTYIDVYLSYAGVYAEKKLYKQSVVYFQKALAIDTDYFKFYYLPYSISLAGEGKFQEAMNALDKFSSLPSLSERSLRSAIYRKRCYTFALQYLKLHPDDNYIFNPINLGDSVNTKQSEYYPSVNINDTLLVFTRRTGRAQEDFFESTVTKKGFSKAKLIDGTLNDEPYKGGITLSADGEWLIFAGNFSGRGFGDFDLYICYWTPKGWSEPQNMGENINSGYWDSSPSLSPDNRVLYFSSNRPGGAGGKDLYRSVRLSTGKWGPATNMGLPINSDGDEQAPYIHPDNQTLYYTSDGLPGYGGTDIFLSRRDISGNWGFPENLGYPINTIDNEGSICVSSDGLVAYYASDRSDSRGGLDIYKFDLRSNIRPYRTIYVKGKVYDAITKKGLPCAVELIDHSNNQPLMRIQTDEEGKYFIPLPTGKPYTFTVNRTGYLFFSQVYDTVNNQADSTYIKDIPLYSIQVNSTLAMNNIQFAKGSADLLPVSKIELDKLLQILQDNKLVKIEIGGHSDNLGKAATNTLLSLQRAQAVVAYLIDKGIDNTRLSAKGYGSSMPIGDNSTEEGRSKNRRTSVTIKSIKE